MSNRRVSWVEGEDKMDEAVCEMPLFLFLLCCNKSQLVARNPFESQSC